MADKSFRTRGSESLPAALPVRVAASSRAITPAPPLPYSQPTKIPNQLQTLARPGRQRLKPLTSKLLSTQKKTIMQTAVQHNSSHSSHFAPTPDTSLSPTQAQVAAALAQGLSVSAAGRQAGVHRTTIHHWFRAEPQFEAAVQNASREYIAALNDDLRDLSANALKTLKDLLEAPDIPPAVRLKAALAVLQRPQFPQPGWHLPERIESPAQQLVVDGVSEMAAYDRVRRAAGAAQPNPAIARCSPCPCGSGRKYKRCCGAGNQSGEPLAVEGRRTATATA